MADRTRSNTALWFDRSGGAGVAGMGAATQSNPGSSVGSFKGDDLGSQLGFDLNDDAWMGLVRESVTAPALGDFAGYRLECEVGRGAQGAVFRAVQPGTGRTVALKHLGGGPLAGSSARDRFAREVSVLSAMRHPNIVSVLGVIETPAPSRHAALVMEFVDGLPLDEWARGQGLRARVLAVAAVCDAIAYAHQRGVMHRDIKPSNVLVDRDGQPRVLDFGLAALLDASQRATASRSGAGMVGTPAFVAPEQAAGGVVDTRSDVYGLGVLLNIALCGQGPGAAGTGGVVRSARAVDASLPADLCAIASTAMAAEPAMRYQSAGAMAEDLRRWVSGMAVLAHPPTLAYRAMKVVQRRPVLTGVVASCVLAVVGSAVVSTVLAVRLAARGDALAGALSRADEKSREAQEHASRSQTLAQTLRDTLNSVSESVAASAPDSVFHVTQEAMERVREVDAVADPVLAESLWYDLGRAASRLGDVVVAEESIQCGMPLALRLYGKDSAQYGRWVMMEGVSWERRENMALAEARYREGYGILLPTLGPADADTGWAANNLGISLIANGRLDEAEMVLVDALFIRIAAHGEKSEQVASTLKNLASVERERGNFPKSHYFNGLSMAAFPAGTDPLSTFRLATVLSQIRTLRDEGRLDEAVAIAGETIGMIRSAQGSHSPHAAKFHQARGLMLRRQQRYEEALADFVAVNDTVLIVPVDHPVRTGRISQLARGYTEVGRHDEAVALLERALTELAAAGKAGTDGARPIGDALERARKAREQAKK